MLKYRLKTAGRETKAAVIAQKLGLADRTPAPEIDERTEYWLELFQILSPSRAMSDYGPRYIPISEIKALIDVLPQPAANDEVILVVRAMDDAYLEYFNSKRPKTPAKRPKVRP